MSNATLSRTSVKAPIRVRTYLRTGSGTRLVEDKVLRPLTAAERKRGVYDEYRAYVAAYGEPGAGRRRPRRVAYIKQDQGCGSNTNLDMKLTEDGMPSQSDQEAVYKLMQPHLKLVARNLAMGGIITYSEVRDMEDALFVVCRDSLPKWEPAKAGLKTFLYECVASATANYVAEQKCQKRAYSYRHFAIVNSPVESEGDDDDAAKESFSDAISIEAIPDRKAIARMEFDWAYNELVALLDADERLALDYLLRDYDQSTVADWMSCTVMWFRRHILRSLQAKAELCGFVPHNGTYV
jgi:hypothetical protein